ncbi:MAG: hypothetical protein K2X45_20730 [Phreatobacter sp.]|nr:hypothetical protein [Phreatobacter sp.]
MIPEVERLYRPFRRFASTLGTPQSLLGIWRAARYLDAVSFGNERPFPFPEAQAFFTTDAPFEAIVYPWDLDVLVREVLMHGSYWSSGSLADWQTFSTAINHIRRIDNDIFPLQLERNQSAALRDIHRIAHRQFPWQSYRHGNVVRYWRILSEMSLSEGLREITGLTTAQIMRLALLIFGHFSEHPYLALNIDLSQINIDSAAASKFLRSISLPIGPLHAAILAAQKYDLDWLYAFNPMVDTPFIYWEGAPSDFLQCPLPALALNRMSERLHFDLLRAGTHGEAIGKAFEAYIFDYASRVLPRDRFAVSPEARYRVGKQQKHGVDVIIDDADAAVFVECKTKRLSVPGKFAADGVRLEGEIDALGGMIARHYSNVLDALGGKTSWQQRECKTFMLLVTLDDWRMFGIHSPSMVADAVKKSLIAKGMPETLWDQMPCMLISAEDFEIVTEIVSKVGLAKFFDKFSTPEFRGWPARGLLLPLKDRTRPPRLNGLR